ncbi:hypothetical protein ASF84_23220 [Pseudomonas sp. Leaf127]|uniref:hypothetical protein n=1 Tax=Pseudomonas sp. Leaf127 TaxID=1736267 RepID=UPI000703425E|nr:hypothetical protein [Pseudomonas sp. Leaf127]KQQ49219.1 hypothetical protein ASF84_23220 [Pseudomonas sp. Leaf127]
MRQDTDFLTILRRHFPVFIGAFFLALFALSVSLILLFALYPSAQADYAQHLVMANLGLAVYLCSANFLVIRGRPWGVWPVVAAMVVCLLVVVFNWGHRGVPQAMYIVGVLLPLLTLLVLNSSRYRAMLAAMVQVREQRTLARKQKK